MTRTLFQFKEKINIKNEMLAGLTVAMTMIPESLSFAILAGLSPLTGLYAAFLMGIVTAVLGGRPGMVSGGAGATVIVLIALAASHGVEYLFAAVLLAGLFQFLVGVFKWGKFVRLIPQPVMYGFLNGLAIVIFVAQLEQFKIYNGDTYTWLQGSALYIMLGLLLLTIAIVTVLPKITKAVPATLVAILVVLCIVYFGGIETKRVMDIASISGSLPQFHVPLVPFTLETLQIITPYALVMAGVGLVESLLTLNLVDERTNTKGNSNREAMAQGMGNVVNGFFGGMGGCAMIAQTFVNLNSGGRTRISAIIGALTILVIILIGSPLIGQIPMVALVGVMMMVAITTFKWASFRMIDKMPKSDIIIGILVAAITVVFHNLAAAVLTGVVVAALVFAWENAQRLRTRQSLDENGRRIYELYGPLFFGSTTKFLDQFDVLCDPDEVIVDFKESRVVDMSAIDALNKLTAKYANHNKKLILRHLSKDCIHLLDNAHEVVEVNIEEHPTYSVIPEQ